MEQKRCLWCGNLIPLSRGGLPCGCGHGKAKRHLCTEGSEFCCLECYSDAHSRTHGRLAGIAERQEIVEG